MVSCYCLQGIDMNQMGPPANRLIFGKKYLFLLK